MAQLEFGKEFKEIEEGLNWSENKRFNSGFLLIEDKLQTDGGFLLNYFINLYVKRNCFVFLISLEEEFSHYLSISKKLGQSLQKAEETGNFCHFNPIHASSELKPDEGELMSGLSEEYLTSLYLHLEDKILKLRGEKKGEFIVVLDNISSLFSFSKSSLAVFDFVSSIRSLTHQSEEMVFLSLIHNLNDVEDDNLEVKLNLELNHSADLLFQTSPLPTGYSRDITGSFSVTYRNPMFCSSDTKFQYRISDNSIKVFSQIA